MSNMGLTGLLTAFKESLGDLKEGSNIVFTGSIGICTPFAQLLAYSVRKSGFEMIFIPKAIAQNAKKMRLIKEVGYQVTNENADPSGCDVIVILGGLAVPKYSTTPDDVLKMIDKISKNAKIIGFGFMSVFEENGWTKAINFDVLINGVIDPVDSYFFDNE